MQYCKKVRYFLLSLLLTLCMAFPSFADYEETSFPSSYSEETESWNAENATKDSPYEAQVDSTSINTSPEEKDAEISNLALEQAVNYGSIVGCQITGNDQITVQFQLSQAISSKDNKLYLFELDSCNNSIGKQEPISSVDIPSSGASIVQFQISLNLNSNSSRLYSKFVVGITGSNMGYIPISNTAVHITNPEAVAQYQYAFPTASSKKGLLANSGMLSDIDELGVRHALINIELNQLVTNGNYAYTYNGKTYYLNSSVISSIDEYLIQLAKSNIITSCVLLAKPVSSHPELIHPNVSGTSSANYYSLNASTKEGIECMTALTHFLAERYSREDKAYGQIVNWIVGNEVNNPNVWNYMGSNPDFNSYMENYSRSLRMIATSVKSVNSCARIYVSLDHYWNATLENRFHAGTLLSSIQTYLDSEGGIPWHMAYHPYPTPMVNPDFTDDPVTQDQSTEVISFKNLQVLTDFLQQSTMKNPDGSVKRTILSEQGFSSVNEYGQDVSEKQAIMLAYAYYIVDANSYIDSILLSRHVDHPIEVSQNINFGLWETNLSDSSGENPLNKKESWEIYKYIDTSQSLAVTAPILDKLGASSWESLVNGFKSNNYTGLYSIVSGSLAKTQSLSGSTKIPNNWESQFYSKITQKLDGGAAVSVEPTYAAAYKCILQKFSQPLDFSSKSTLGLNITVNGLPTSGAKVRVRLFSGDNVCDGEALVTGGQKTGLNMDIKSWAYKNNVTKMQVWVKQDGSEQWNSGSFVLEDVVQADSAVSLASIDVHDARTSSPSAKSYQVSCSVYASDSIDRVEFTTWNNQYGESRSVLHNGTIYGQNISCKVDISSITGGDESYTTKIVAYDKSGAASSPVYVTMELGKPILSDIMVTNISSTGYTVTCNATSTIGIKRALCPTWTEKDGQDDIIWHEAKVSGSLITYDVKTSAHNNESGTYYTHIYAYDTKDNYSLTGTTIQVPAPNGPVISDTRISDLDYSGYTVTCRVSSYYGIDKVLFPTWTEKDDQDDLIWHTGTVKNGIATVRISISDHNNENGKYNTHIYAYDKENNTIKDEVTVTVPQVPKKTLEVIGVDVSNINSDGYQITVVVNDISLVSKTQFPTWTDKDWQDDITWDSGSVEDNTISYYVSSSKHNNESGLYYTHVYIYDQNNTSYVYPCDVYVPSASDSSAVLKGRAHVQDIGWQDWSNGSLFLGTEGMSKRLEALQLSVDTGLSGTIQYATHVQDIGWQDFVSANQTSGTEGMGKRLEALKIKLTGQLEQSYDIYYRTHIQNYGWLDWAKNGENAGSEGLNLRMEAMEIRLVKKGSSAPGSTNTPFVKAQPAASPSLSYQCHVQDYDWLDFVNNGEVGGTVGSGKRMEALRINLNTDGLGGGIEYSTHIENIGWQDFVNNGEVSGTVGRSLKLQALRIRLTGEMAEKYDIYYRTHVENYGWLDWAKNDQNAGTEGFNLRMEAIEIRLVEKGSSAPGSTQNPFVKR